MEVGWRNERVEEAPWLLRQPLRLWSCERREDQVRCALLSERRWIGRKRRPSSTVPARAQGGLAGSGEQPRLRAQRLAAVWMAQTGGGRRSGRAEWRRRCRQGAGAKVGEAVYRAPLGLVSIGLRGRRIKATVDRRAASQSIEGTGRRGSAGDAGVGHGQRRPG